MIVEKIEQLLAEKFSEPDFADCFVVEIKLEQSEQRLEVYVDSDSGMDFSKCQKISRYLEPFLDEGAWLGPTYVLEVSSPGIERPLKFHRQYHRNIGRTLQINLKEGEPREGVLKTVNPESIILEQEIKFKEGKRNKKEIIQTVIPFEHITKAIVKITF